MLLLFLSLLSTHIGPLHLSSKSLCSLGQELFLPASHEILPNSEGFTKSSSALSLSLCQLRNSSGNPCCRKGPVLTHLSDYQIRVMFFSDISQMKASCSSWGLFSDLAPTHCTKTGQCSCSPAE